MGPAIYFAVVVCAMGQLQLPTPFASRETCELYGNTVVQAAEDTLNYPGTAESRWHIQSALHLRTGEWRIVCLPAHE